MSLLRIKDSQNVLSDLSSLLEHIHEKGAENPKTLEVLSFYKEFHPDEFSLYEEKILSALGLFYKINNPDNLYSFLMSQFGYEHKKSYGSVLTPVQASIRRAVDSYQYTSISAPTSAGKSYSIRDFIAEGVGDAVIIVPSRALIAEYVNTMRSKFGDDKGVMISSFVDLVYTSRDLRRVFILTPERSKDLFRVKNKLNIQTFFFDEAQTSEELQRGVVFDVAVRRIRKHFSDAKIIFAHPFVENPQAQFSKHNIVQDQGYARSYSYGSVGRICVFEHSNGKCYYFSPYLENGHRLKGAIEFPESFKSFALSGGKSVLLYVSKNSIYQGGFLQEFSEYIDRLKNVTDARALEIINNIEHIWGADKVDHKSSMVELLRKGVVIHHGSVPLEVRFLIEDFIKSGYATLCFATSTLAQGVNMPFDIVWLINNRFPGSNEEERALSFKNLIGRAGRSSQEQKFDYGYVYTSSPKIFSRNIKTQFHLNEQSVLDNPDIQDEDTKDLINSIKDDTFDDDKNLPLSRVERLSQDSVLSSVKNFLDIICKNKSIKEGIGGKSNRVVREWASNYLKGIFEASLGRSLEDGEGAVFDSAIMIFFLMAQGYSFKEIASIRYNMIRNRDKPAKPYASFLQPASSLPDKSLEKAYSLYPQNTPKDKVSYDLIVFDTYDYIDKVITFSMSDVFIAAFKIYKELTYDERVDQVIELFRYGTNDAEHILLMRYGFPSEMVNEIAHYVERVDENEIVFKNAVYQAPRFIQEIVAWYLPE